MNRQKVTISLFDEAVNKLKQNVTERKRGEYVSELILAADKVSKEEQEQLCQTHSWRDYVPTYRAREVKLIARWILTGASGSIIGLKGAGKSDLLGFLCHRPEVLNTYLPARTQPVTLLPMDFNNLTEPTLSAFFRFILRTFAEHRMRFGEETQALINQIYQENRAVTDSFLSQSALRELLFHFQQRHHRIVFVMDSFDTFCNMLTPAMGDALGGLYNGFKDILLYIVAMRLELDYLPETEMLGNLSRLLDQQVCYIGPMNEQDTHNMVTGLVQMVDHPPTDAEIRLIWLLSGGYPSLVMALCRWWLTQSPHPPLAQWPSVLSKTVSVYHRLADIWEGLTQEEQMVLSEVQKNILSGQYAYYAAELRHSAILDNLVGKGICRREESSIRIFSPLFADYVAQVGSDIRGKIWLEPNTEALYHGQSLLTDLTPKEYAVLRFLTQQPYQRHTHTDVIVAAWSENERYHGVTNDSLYQVMRGLRQKIEPNPSQPVYIVNWRGRPEGGYQFFPEGRPR